MANIFSKEQLLQFNEMMLQRGVPNTEDGIGYNKADYGTCSTYYYGLSNAQLADLAKRLVKYSETQLGICKDDIKETAKELAKIAKDDDRSEGISVDIREDGMLISFRYNEVFIEKIKTMPKRRWDAESKNWIVPLEEAVPTLNALWTIGADVENALTYVMGNDIYLNWLDSQNDKEIKKTEILTKFNGDYAFLKFNYDKNIVDTIKQIDKKDRQWNADFKFWMINKNYLNSLQESLAQIAYFKQI